MNQLNHMVCVSGGFDPLHTGHLNMFREAASHGQLWVILNSDEWLIRKKGFVFQTWKDRAEIIGSTRFVFKVIPVDDGDGSVCEALSRIRPKYFLNGGDRKQDNTPEVVLCNSLGIELLFDIGGEKSNSSSHIAQRSTTQRPWGSYRIIDTGEGYKVKQIVVNPGHEISLQYHKRRTEHWVIVKGHAKVQLGEEIKYLRENDAIKIPTWGAHRLSNDTDVPLVVIETQLGAYLEEDDIVRMEDKYGRM